MCLFFNPVLLLISITYIQMYNRFLGTTCYSGCNIETPQGGCSFKTIDNDAINISDSSVHIENMHVAQVHNNTTNVISNDNSGGSNATEYMLLGPDSEMALAQFTLNPPDNTDNTTTYATNYADLLPDKIGKTFSVVEFVGKNENQNGCITSTNPIKAPAIFVTSDKRSKESIRPINNAREILNKLRGYSYKLKDTNRPSMGLLAQEVDKVLPEAVLRLPWSSLDTNTDDKDANQALSVDYNAMIPVLLEGIKDLQRQVEELRETQLSAV